MSTLRLLDDQPATTDRLQFQRYLAAIETKVLQRAHQAPLVVGIYGGWGTGKSTLLTLLAQRLQQQPAKWEVVSFSPWLYRHEDSLLLPLLATLARQAPPLRGLVNTLFTLGTRFMQVLSFWGFGHESKLNHYLSSKRTPSKPLMDLPQHLAQQIKQITDSGKQLIFLIDDLDRCPSKQIVEFLEQIYLFLRLEHCLFFLAVDKFTLLQALEWQFDQRRSQSYLDKFIQLSFELPPVDSSELIAHFNLEDQHAQQYLRHLAEVFAANPRFLKRIFNQAVIRLTFINQNNAQDVHHQAHQPQLERMLKWILLERLGVLIDNPYHYLTLEARAQHALTPEAQAQLKQDFLTDLGFQHQGHWQPSANQQLAIFLWQQLTQHCFHEPQILSLYAHSRFNDPTCSRLLIEENLFAGRQQLTQHNFAGADLSGGHFSGMHFIDCDFRGANFQDAHLERVIFERCQLSEACFNAADIDNTLWLACSHLERLATEPEHYELIADQAVASWRQRHQFAECVWSSAHVEALYKVYKTIIASYREKPQTSEAVLHRLTAKGQAIRAEILQMPAESTESSSHSS